jgi:hypothetical protein
MRIRKIRNIERRLTTSVRGLPSGGVLGLLLFTSQLAGLGCGGRTMLGSLPTVGPVGGSAATSEQNTGGSGAGGAQAGGGLQPEGGSILLSGGLAAGGTPTGGVSMGGAVSGASGSSGSDTHPLWRESSQPFCSDSTPWVGLLKVWSDARGVFVLGTLGGLPTISANTGSGWNTTYTWPWPSLPSDQLFGAPGVGLKGFVNGPLIVYNARGDVFSCPIEFIDGGVASCSGAQSARDVAVVNSNLAYAVYQDRVLRFDGNFWTQLGGPLTGGPGLTFFQQSVWADASTIVAVADGGVWVIPSGGDPVLQKGLPEVSFGAVWGFGASDIWIGNVEGQLYHYDGVAWSLKASIPGDCGGIYKLWGSEGSLFVLTRNLFGRWDGSGITTLSSLPCDAAARFEDAFEDLWGNSPSEVFVVLENRTPGIAGCGPVQVQWFNGSVVSPL